MGNQLGGLPVWDQLMTIWVSFLFVDDAGNSLEDAAVCAAVVIYLWSKHKMLPISRC
jgi:hypothetical protein